MTRNDAVVELAMKSCRLFEDLARRTWHRIDLGYRLGVRQGEETITDIVLLDLALARCADVLIAKTSKAHEKDKGTDWEWWIGRPDCGWWGYAVQAKVIDVRTNIYQALAHKVGGKRQLDVLTAYASRHRLIPIYCLFTYTSDFGRQDGISGPVPYSPLEQYGCSVVPAQTIDIALSKRGGRRFGSLFRTGTLHPWRTLVCDSAFTPQPGAQHPFAQRGTSVGPHVEVPTDIASQLQRVNEPTIRSLGPKDRRPLSERTWPSWIVQVKLAAGDNIER